MALPSARCARTSARCALLAQRVAGHRREPGEDRLAVAPRVGQPVTAELERVHAELGEALALEQHPVLVPARQQLAVQQRVEQLAFAARRAVLEQGGPQAPRPPHVDVDLRCEREQIAPHREDARGRAAQLPQRRAQVARGACLADLGPEQTGDVATGEAAVVQGEHGDHALVGRSEEELVAEEAQGEPPEQREPYRGHDPTSPLGAPGAVPVASATRAARAGGVLAPGRTPPNDVSSHWARQVTTT